MSSLIGDGNEDSLSLGIDWREFDSSGQFAEAIEDDSKDRIGLILSELNTLKGMISSSSNKSKGGDTSVVISSTPSKSQLVPGTIPSSQSLAPIGKEEGQLSIDRDSIHGLLTLQIDMDSEYRQKIEIPFYKRVVELLEDMSEMQKSLPHGGGLMGMADDFLDGGMYGGGSNGKKGKGGSKGGKKGVLGKIGGGLRKVGGALKNSKVQAGLVGTAITVGSLGMEYAETGKVSSASVGSAVGGGLGGGLGMMLGGPIGAVIGAQLGSAIGEELGPMVETMWGNREEIYAKAKDFAGGIQDKMSEYLGDAADAVASKWQETSQATSDLINQGLKSVTDTYDSAKQAASNKITEFETSINDKVTEVADSAFSQVDKVVAMASEAKDKITSSDNPIVKAALNVASNAKDGYIEAAQVVASGAGCVASGLNADSSVTDTLNNVVSTLESYKSDPDVRSESQLKQAEAKAPIILENKDADAKAMQTAISDALKKSMDPLLTLLKGQQGGAVVMGGAGGSPSMFHQDPGFSRALSH